MRQGTFLLSHRPAEALAWREDEALRQGTFLLTHRPAKALAWREDGDRISDKGEAEKFSGSLLHGDIAPFLSSVSLVSGCSSSRMNCVFRSGFAGVCYNMAWR